ncbi:MAG TPA: glycogen synthase GlgA [Alphaproteobacteria bacterium]|nr:glycogen synthase GlgA [Alphaproteobacteria bacterium]
MKILFVASEVYPLIKTGGLADVAGALPPALGRLGFDVRVLVPGYPALLDGMAAEGRVRRIPELFGQAARLIEGRVGDLKLIALDAPGLYDRPGNPYLGPDGKDWPDNHLRFAALSWVAAQIGGGAPWAAGWTPEVVHVHDWQGGLAPVYLARQPKRPATVLTIHNLAYQGLFPFEHLSQLRLRADEFRVAGVEFYGRIGFLKGGLWYADRLTTVSPTYAREIQTPAFGCGLEGLLAGKGGALVGILNGIDTEVWDPATDPLLAATFTAEDTAGKAAGKADLQRIYGLEERADAPLFTVISRLTEQKGLDLLLAALPTLLNEGAQIAVLGSGDKPLEAGFLAAAAAHPKSVGVRIGYDEALSHRLQAGGDVMVVPSRFEPCGLTQMYALRYGSLPLVRRTGGLADTVVDATEAAMAEGTATGFVFDAATPAALAEAAIRACRLYRRPEAWRRLQRTAMAQDFSWTRSAEEYRKLYDGLRPAAAKL